MKWQPIETAPIKPFDKEQWFMSHSDIFLLWTGSYCQIGNYGYTKKGKGRWQSLIGNIYPTHWMPLPPKPEAA